VAIGSAFLGRPLLAQGLDVATGMPTTPFVGWVQ